MPAGYTVHRLSSSWIMVESLHCTTMCQTIVLFRRFKLDFPWQVAEEVAQDFLQNPNLGHVPHMQCTHLLTWRVGEVEVVTQPQL